MAIVDVNLDITTANVPDSTDRRYVTDDQQTVIENTSGTNTGDQDLSGLATLEDLDEYRLLTNGFFEVDIQFEPNSVLGINQTNGNNQLGLVFDNGETLDIFATDSINTTNIQLAKSHAKIGSTDPNFKGLNYNSDYSANYDDRSLVDKGYVNGLISLTFRPAGNWDASGNTFPTTGTGSGGAVRAGDVYNTTVSGTPSGFETLDVGDNFYSVVNSPGQIASNWAKFETNTQQATESFRGTNKIATTAIIQDETTTNNIDAVTPVKFWLGWTRIKALSSQVISAIWEFLGIDYTPTSAPAYKRGRMWYNQDDETISFYDDISGTSNELNQEDTIRARNNTGATILDGKAVYISGSTGLNPTIVLARADAENTSLTIGLATHDIANNTVGKITISGLVKNIDTSAFSDGDALFLSTTTAGELTNVAPSSPNFSVFVGFVVKSHVTQGKILVRTEQPIATNTALGSSNRIAPSQMAVKTYVDQQLITTPKIILKSITDVSHTGDTNVTQVYSELITGATFSVSNFLNLYAQFRKVGTAGNLAVRFYVNTSNSLVGATQIAQFNSGVAANLYYGVARMGLIKSATNTEIYNSTSSIISSIVNSSTAVSSLNIDWTVNQYFLISIQLTNATDTGTLSGLFLERK